MIQISFYTIGAFLILLAIYRKQKYKSTESWIEVTAVIKTMESKVFPIPDSSDYCYPAATYSYSYKGKEYESSTISFNLSNIWVVIMGPYFAVTEEYNHRFWCKWKRGLRIIAFINPNNPKKSVIIKSMSKNFKETNLSLFVAGILSMIFSYYGVPYLVPDLI